jgi:hypothetical protein
VASRPSSVPTFFSADLLQYGLERASCAASGRFESG